jgi:hypothetical protein
LQAFYAIEPRGEIRADLRAGLQSLHALAASGAKPASGRAFELHDLMLRFDEPLSAEQEIARSEAALHEIAAVSSSSGAAVERPTKDS